MRRVNWLLWVLVCLVGLGFVSEVDAQTYYKRQGYCQRPAQRVTTNGATSTTTVMQIVPGCTVTVYPTGSLSLASLYSTNSGTVRANPVTADANGYYWYYAAAGRYDERFSGGTSPNSYPSPVTLTDVVISPMESASQTDLYAYDYGVRCDGSTDNTTNLATAQAAARTAGKRLILPAGTCLTQQMVLTDNDNIKGAGLEKTIIKGTADQAVVTVATTAFNARLEDVSVSGDTSLSSQVGISAGGNADYWGLTIRNVWIKDVGSHGFYLGQYPFSVNFDNIHVDNPVGYLVYVYSPYAPGLVFKNLYLHRINTGSTLKVGFRVRRGSVTCENCNGLDNAPPIAGTVWAKIGEKSGTDGASTNNPAFVSWKKTNFEMFESVGVDHLSSSVSAFEQCTWIYGGTNTNRIALQYEMDDSGTITYSAWTAKGTIDDKSDFSNNQSGYKNSAAIHSNTLPPLIVNGQGINAGGVATAAVNSYYDTSQSHLVPLMRADGNDETITVTGDKSFTRAVYGDIEVNASGAVNLTIPWPGWYRVARPLTIRDVSGNAFTNNITILVNGGGTIGGTSFYAIKRNYGAVRLVPNATATDWRVVDGYPGGLSPTYSVSGSPNQDFFPRWSNTQGELTLSSAIYQSGSDVALNGGSLVHVKSGQTFTLAAPSGAASSLSVFYPALTGTRYMALTSSATPSNGCAEFSSGLLVSTGSACGSGGGGSGTVTSVALAAGTSGTDVNVSGSPVTSSGTITLNIPDASGSARGVVTTGTQTFAGAKTFDSTLTTRNINPAAADMYTLGTSLLPWLEVHVTGSSLVVHGDLTNTKKVTYGYSGSTGTIKADASSSIQLTTGTNDGLTINTSGNATFGGTVAATSFSGSGASLTGLSASQLSSGTAGLTVGGTGQSTWAANEVLVGTGTNTAALKTIPSCSDATTSKLLYNNSTQSFTCGTDQGGGGGGGITSLGGLNGSSQTFGNDTNVTMVSSGTTHTITWAGTLAVTRGGTGLDTSGSTGVLRVSSGTWSANAGISHLAASSSSDLRGVLSDETGSGVAVFGTQPTIDKPVITSYTYATLPTPATNMQVVVTDCANTTCSTGGGSTVRLLRYSGSAWAVLGDGDSGGTPAFSSITAGTNTAALLIGTGGSLGVTGSGTIAATSVTGLSVTAGKTLTVSNSITLAGTDTTTMTFPNTSGSVLTADSANTLTNKTFNTAGTGNTFQINGTGITAVSGSGAVALVNTPTLITPVLGVATATSVNKVAITAPTTSATLALSDGSTLATSGGHSLTFTTAGATNVTLPTSGTLVNSAVTTLSSLASVGTISSGTWQGTVVELAYGGTGRSLTDPNANRIMFWDDTNNRVDWLTLGTNLSITGTTLNASGGGGGSSSTGTGLQYGDGVGGFSEVTGSSVSGGAVTLNPSTTSLRAFTLGMANRSLDGQTDSHKFYLTAKGRSSSVNHTSEILQWVDISSDDASDGRYRVQQSYDSGTATDLFTADAFYGLTSPFLSIFDSNASNRITLLTSENTTADYNLDYRPNGANRTINLSGNLTLGAGLTTTTAAITLAANASGSSVTLPISGTLATLAGSETLTNKTLTTPIISSISNTGTLTLPTSTDTLVGRATTDTLTNKSIDVEGTGNTLTIVSKIWLDAAGNNAGTAAANWDLPSSNAPSAAAISGTNVLQGVLDFADGGTDLTAQRTLHLPSDWTGNIDVKFKWLSSTTSGNVIWGVAAACVADGVTNDPSFTTWNDASPDAAKGTANQTNDASVTSITTTGSCAAGSLIHFNIARRLSQSGDTMAGTARLIGVEITLRRAQ